MCSRRAAVRVGNGLLSKRSLSFPAAYRLKRRAEYQRVYMHGVRVSGRHVVLFVAEAQRSVGRFGVTASKRVGGAVKRSRCKRRLRELYRLFRDPEGAAEIDVVANARRSCASAPWPELESEFRRSLRAAVKRVVMRGNTTAE